MPKEKCDSNSWYKSHLPEPTPISTTHEMLQKGSEGRVTHRPAAKIITFETYPMDDNRFDLLLRPIQIHQSMNTTYEREFKRPYGFIPRPFKNPHDKPSPDNLFNRVPLNQFGLYPYASTKFMDDHMFDISEERKKVNFFRQMRNAHYRFGT